MTGGGAAWGVVSAFCALANLEAGCYTLKAAEFVSPR